MDKAVVLVVEDEALIRLSALQMVEDAGFIAVEACDATEAVAMLESRPDVRAVFTDINMPGSMDGWELAHKIRRRWPPIHLIIASGMYVLLDEQLPTRGLFIRKPYSAPQLTAALREVFGHGPDAGDARSAF